MAETQMELWVKAALIAACIPMFWFWRWKPMLEWRRYLKGSGEFTGGTMGAAFERRMAERDERITELETQIKVLKRALRGLDEILDLGHQGSENFFGIDPEAAAEAYAYAYEAVNGRITK